MIKVSGALKGVVRLPSFDATVGELRTEVARLLGVEDPGCVKLIAAGRSLQDDAKPVSGYNVGPNTRLLVTKGAAAQHSVSGQEAAQRSEEARLAQLERLKATVQKLADRGDGRGLSDKREFSLENQDGLQLHLSEADRKALVFGLALHEKGKASLEAGDVQMALDELLLAEESFSVVTPSLLEGIDNLAMLLLDIVWCYFMLKDIRRLGVCGERLTSARQRLEKAHGAHQERLRQLHGNFSPELTTYVRLELLEGVVAFHSGEQQLAQQRLQSAQARWRKLQLSEDALLQLAELGYSHKSSCRALRFSGGDVAAAVDFLTAQEEKKRKRQVDRAQQRAWQNDRVRYGKTDGGKYVDQHSLDQLVSLGYELPLAAEALRQSENDANAALDALTNQRQRGALQLALATQQALEDEFGPQWVKSRHVSRLQEMGFKEKAVRQALAAAGDKLEAALERLEAMGDDARAVKVPRVDAGAAGSSGVAAAAAGAAGADPSTAGAAAAAAAGAGDDAMQADAAGDVDDGAGAAAATAAAAADGGAAPSSSSDDEMAAEVLRTVAGKGKDDPLAAYDINVEEDGEAIQTYLSMLESSSSS